MNRFVRTAIQLPLLLLGAAFVGCGDRSGAKSDEHANHGTATTTSAEATATTTIADDAATGAEHIHGAVPEGYAEVTIAPDRQQLIGIKTARTERATMGGMIRATARVEADEKRVAHVHSKLMGWIEKLFVNTVGQRVSKGQPLYSIYSQDLLVAQEEFLRALEFNAELAAAARQRLALWDIPEDQIAAIETSRKPIKAVVVRAPISGTVLEKNVVKGHYVGPDTMLYLLADLSQVWIVAEVYEYELDRLDRRGTARITIEGRADAFEGTIDYVYPTVDNISRTVKVRLVVPNPRGELRPGNFATVELPARAGDVVQVPEEAVIDTGTHQIVYLALGEGRFRPVQVKLGRRAGGKIEILEGLSEGTEVVTSAQFLLDSESRLRGSGTPSKGHGSH